MALDDVYFGDRDLLHVAVDLRRAEGRITFSGAALRSGLLKEELACPILVLSGLRSWATLPATARPEAIVLNWRLAPTPGGIVAEFLVIGDPEPVTLRFECERIHLEA